MGSSVTLDIADPGDPGRPEWLRSLAELVRLEAHRLKEATGPGGGPEERLRKAVETLRDMADVANPPETMLDHYQRVHYQRELLLVTVGVLCAATVFAFEARACDEMRAREARSARKEADRG